MDGPDEVLPTSDKADDPESICRLLVAFALLDDELDPRELGLISEFSKEFGYSESSIERAVSTIDDQSNAELIITECVQKIGDPETRELVSVAIFEICQADDVIHPNEKTFLDVIERYWNISIDFISTPNEWDPEQLEIIVAPASARLLVSAGPGMGKTAVACARVSHLIEQDAISPSNIWMISFTRAAVSELGDRISSFADNAQNVLGVSVATIDSKAWHLRSGFDAASANTLFGCFDTAIKDAINMIDEHEDDYADFFEGIDHLIIDEAQDISGIRAGFLSRVIELLREDCGMRGARR